MAYREVHVVEIREVLRLWLQGRKLRSISRMTGVDRKTVRRLVMAAERVGVGREAGEAGLDDGVIGQIVEQVRARGPGAHGSSWVVCQEHREELAKWVEQELRLTKVQTLLERHSGVRVPYRTLHRFASRELGFGRGRVTVRVADCEPGQEVQVDFGRLGWLVDTETGKRVVVWGLVFTAVFSRHQFVWLSRRQTLESVIAGCEAAWRFFGGVFRVMIPDNLSAVINQADPLGAQLSPGFREYSQACGFVVDAARVRHATDKPRVERSVPYVRESLFAGEVFASFAEAQAQAERWCLEVAGQRIHGTTRQRPLEVFESQERAHLLPVPAEPYELPDWSEAKVHRDHHIRVAGALYSLPTRLIGERVKIRVDSKLVKIYHRGQLVKVRPRVAPGERLTDPEDYPPGRAAYACRDAGSLLAQAGSAGEAVGHMAERLLASPLPWTRMRQVYRLLGLVRRYGGTPVNRACQRALELDVVDVTRVSRMLEIAAEGEVTGQPPAVAASPAVLRFLRPKESYRIRNRRQGEAHDPA